MSQGAALTLCASAVGVSMFYRVRHGDDPIPVMVIGGIFTGICVGVSQINPDLGTALAAVFFLGIFLSRGTELINWSTDFVNGSNKQTAKGKGKAHGG